MSTKSRAIAEITADIEALEKRQYDLKNQADDLLSDIEHGRDTAKHSARRSDVMQQLEASKLTRARLEAEYKQARVAEFFPVWDGYCQDYAQVKKEIADAEAEIKRLSGLIEAQRTKLTGARERLPLAQSRVLRGAGKAQLKSYLPDCSYADTLREIAEKHGIADSLPPSVFRGDI